MGSVGVGLLGTRALARETEFTAVTCLYTALQPAHLPGIRGCVGGPYWAICWLLAILRTSAVFSGLWPSLISTYQIRWYRYRTTPLTAQQHHAPLTAQHHAPPYHPTNRTAPLNAPHRTTTPLPAPLAAKHRTGFQTPTPKKAPNKQTNKKGAACRSQCTTGSSSYIS
jgi:hypothetical protein